MNNKELGSALEREHTPAPPQAGQSDDPWKFAPVRPSERICVSCGKRADESGVLACWH